MKVPRCIRCNRKMRSAVRVDEREDAARIIWEMPSGAVVLEGGGNFGSQIYDSLMDGIEIQVMLCDACIKKLGEEHVREVERPVFLGVPNSGSSTETANTAGYSHEVTDAEG